jgi:hypothetical protein
LCSGIENPVLNPAERGIFHPWSIQVKADLVVGYHVQAYVEALKDLIKDGKILRRGDVCPCQPVSFGTGTIVRGIDINTESDAESYAMEAVKVEREKLIPRLKKEVEKYEYWRTQFTFHHVSLTNITWKLHEPNTFQWVTYG